MSEESDLPDDYERAVFIACNPGWQRWTTNAHRIKPSTILTFVANRISFCAHTLPHYLKFVQTRDLLVMLNEYNGIYARYSATRRPLPKDPNPSWQGYSAATPSGDVLDIESIGFRDDLWIDWDGSVITESARSPLRVAQPQLEL